MVDWVDELFDGKKFERTWKAESYLFNLLDNAVLDEGEYDFYSNLIMTAESQQDIDVIIRNLTLNQKRLIDQYAPTQTQISEFIKSII